MIIVAPERGPFPWWWDQTIFSLLQSGTWWIVGVLFYNLLPLGLYTNIPVEFACFLVWEF